MKVTLRELRQIINEGLDPMKLIVIATERTSRDCILVDDKNQIRGSIYAYRTSGVYDITTAWAADPRAAWALFASSLYTLQRVTPNRSLSPAALAVIKRWFNKHKDDGSVEMPDDSNELKPETAVYGVPEGFESPIPIETMSSAEATKNGILAAAESLFSSAYASEKSGFRKTLDKYLLAQDTAGLSRLIKQQSWEPSLLPQLKQWITSNAKKLEQLPDSSMLQQWITDRIGV